MTTILLLLWLMVVLFESTLLYQMRLIGGAVWVGCIKCVGDVGCGCVGVSFGCGLVEVLLLGYLE